MALVLESNWITFCPELFSFQSTVIHLAGHFHTYLFVHVDITKMS